MSRSMHFFRKNAKPLLAVFCVVLTVLWVGGSFLEPTPRLGMENGDDEGNRVVVTYDGGSLREADLQQMRYRHNLAVSFLAGIVNQTIQNGGTPQAPGLDISPQGQIVSPGIPVDDSDAALVQTMLLAEKARDLGVTIDNDSVKDFLSRLSAYTMKEGDWFDIAQKAIPRESGFSIGQLFERLQVELLAQHMRMMQLSGLTAVSSGQIMPITPPPSELWEYFLRLHRQAKIEAVPFEVSQYIKQVKDPTRADEAELRALFEKGRDRDPNPAFPEPGFYRPQKAAFEYFRVDFQPFLEEAKKQITEEQIKAEYEKAISQGQYKALELPPESDDAPPSQDAPKSETTDEPKEDGADADAPKSDEAKPANAPPPAENTPPPANEKPAEEQPAEENSSDEPAPEPKPDEGNVGTFRGAGQTLRFVSTQADEAVEKAAQESDEPEAADKSDAPPPAENDPPAEADKPAPSADAPPADEKAADEKAASDKPADATADAEKPADEAQEQPKFKPLEEVRDDVINRLAQPIAEDARQAAVQKLVEAVRDYGQQYRRYQTALENKSKSPKDPGKFNPEAIAKSIPGAEAFSTPLITRYQAGEYPIGQNANIFDWQTGGSYGFGDVAFGPDEILYEPKYVNSREPDVLYIFWRTEAEPPATPTFEEARDEVVAAWKRLKAFDIAQQEAETLAKKAEKAKSLKDVAEPTIVITPPAFSWLTLGSVPFGMSRPELGTVAGIEYAGVEFMQSVFALEETEAGTAVNQPHSRVYAVKMLELQPSLEELRDRFAESGLFETMSVVSGEWQDAVRQQRQQLDEEFNVSWQRPPEPGSRMR